MARIKNICALIALICVPVLQATLLDAGANLNDAYQAENTDPVLQSESARRSNRPHFSGNRLLHVGGSGTYNNAEDL